MKLSLSHVVRGVEPDEAAAWWSDFRDGRHDHAFLPGERRVVLARDAGRVVMEDELRVLGRRLFIERTTAWPDGREVRFAGRNTFALFDGVYRFEPHPRGTRIRLETNVVLGRPFDWADVAARPLVDAILRVDLAGHAKDMRSALIGGRQNASSRRA